MAPHKLSILVEAIGTAKAAKNLKGIDATVSRIGAHAGKGLRTAGDNLMRLGTIAAGITAGGIVASVKAAADFESQLNTINTVAGVSQRELDKIGEGIRRVARETGASLDELTAGYYDLVSAGIDAGQAQRVLESSTTLAIGGLASAAETVDLITTALNAYGVAAKDQGAESERFADIFAKAIERGKVTAADLAGSFATVGPIAKSLGIEIEEVAAGYAQLTAKGVPAAEAATQMNSAMVAFLRKSGPLKKLEKQTGRNYQAIAGTKGLAAAYEQLRIDAQKAGVPLIELVGRKEALQYALLTTGTELVAYTENLDAMTDAQGTAARQMGERQKGLNFQLDRLKALARDAGITIGAKLLPKITPLAERAVAFLDTHQDDIAAFGDKIASGFDKALAFAERIPWAQIGSGLQVAADWAGKLMDVFLGLPPEVQTTIIALAGLNKLSGGAIGAIAGELGKGLIKGVLGMTAGVVNINAATVRGGVPVGGPVAGGGVASRIGSAVRVLGSVAIAGASIAALAETWNQFNAGNEAAREDLRDKTQGFTETATLSELRGSLQGINDYVANLDPIKAGIYALDIGGVRSEIEATKASLETRIAALTAAEYGSAEVSRRLSADIRGVRDSINSKNWSPRVTVNAMLQTMVSVRNVTTGQQTIAKYGQVGIR